MQKREIGHLLVSQIGMEWHGGFPWIWSSAK